MCVLFSFCCCTSSLFSFVILTATNVISQCFRCRGQGARQVWVRLEPYPQLWPRYRGNRDNRRWFENPDSTSSNDNSTCAEFREGNFHLQRLQNRWITVWRRRLTNERLLGAKVASKSKSNLHQGRKSPSEAARGKETTFKSFHPAKSGTSRSSSCEYRYGTRKSIFRCEEWLRNWNKSVKSKEYQRKISETGWGWWLGVCAATKQCRAFIWAAYRENIAICQVLSYILT